MGNTESTDGKKGDESRDVPAPRLSGVLNANDNSGTLLGDGLGALSAEELIGLSLETGTSIADLLRGGYECSEPESARTVQMLSTMINRQLDLGAGGRGSGKR